MRRTIKTLALVETAALLLFAANRASRSETRRASLADALRLFPGYHVVSLKEYDPDTRNYLLENCPKVDPSVVRADFDGDGSPDFGLLLKNDATHVARVVILLCPARASCKAVYDLDVSQMSGIVYLRPIPPGAPVPPADDDDASSSIKQTKLKTAAVELNY